jgi:1-acyl-sn-glycerol-3-phosphate acyltransferase
MAEHLQAGGRLVLFAEGRITLTGSLMKVYDGTGFLIRQSGAKVITCYLRGAARGRFVRHHGWTRWLPRVTAHFSDALTAPEFPGLSNASGPRESHHLAARPDDAPAVRYRNGVRPAEPARRRLRNRCQHPAPRRA